MQAAARPKVMAGLALAGANLIVATPIAAQSVDHLSTADVRLTTTSFDLPGLDGLSGLDLGGIQNIPYNLFADVVNIPFYESEGLQEYASALASPSNDLGVPGWLPPGALQDGAVGANGAYDLGGTGSWYTETLGNTWGWDDGNWPQVDGLLHLALPFSFTENIASQFETFAQAELTDGAGIGCEFECANPIGYLAGWLHGGTSLQSLLDGTTFPKEIQGDVGNPFLPTFWGNGTTSAQLNPLEPLQAIANNLTGAPQAIQLPDLATVAASAEQIAQNDLADFNPYVTGSYVYWGAPTDYSIPAAIGGTIQEFTGIPNQFGFPADQALGSEPATGPTDGPLSLLTGLPQGIEYLFTGPGGAVNTVDATGGDGLLGYLNPGTYLTAIESLANGHLPAIVGELPGLGYLGINVPTDLGSASDFSSILPGASDFTGLMGNTFDPASLVGDLSGLTTNLGASDIPDLALNALTSIF